jgi:hypothetical protein
MLSPHAVERIASSGRFTPAEIDKVGRVAERVAQAFSDRDVASRIATCPYRATGTDTGYLTRESNGDEVWVVARRGTVVTVLLRRSTQPATPEAFRVDIVAHGLRIVPGRA